MAKSLRSKHKRKMRAVKRIRNGQKELVKLKETVAILNSTNEGGEGIDMSQLSDTVVLTNAKAVKEAAKAREVETSMEVDGKKYNKKTMKDADGNYPPWFNKRRVKQLQLKNKKEKKKMASGKKKAPGKRRHR
ncbi:protein LLP homolog [Cloeon dipterum]|uniref:protein LLP homolog n=1 Tax=Cloeon dipterum TaxID=197152 RepID=UPI0032207FE7